MSKVFVKVGERWQELGCSENLTLVPDNMGWNNLLNGIRSAYAAHLSFTCIVRARFRNQLRALMGNGKRRKITYKTVKRDCAKRNR